VHKASLRGYEPSAQPWRSLQVLPHFLASSTAFNVGTARLALPAKRLS